MKFANADILFALFAIPLLVIFFFWAKYARQRARDSFALPSKLSSLAEDYSRTGRVTKHIFLLLALIFLVLAAARPQWGTHAVMLKRQGLDIMIILDTSKSMDAEDMKPSRLEKAKQEIRGIVERLSGDRVGLVLFAGASFVHCPLTLDYSAFNIFMDVVDSDIIETQGTAIGDAVKTAITAFDQSERKYKVIILITDGEDHDTKPIEAAEKAHEEGIRIFTIGIGSVRGEPIPIKNRRGDVVGYKKNEDGSIVMSQLDEQALQRMADVTDGQYYQATAGEIELDRIYDEILGMEKKELEGSLMTQYEDRFQYPLVAGIILLILEFLITDKKLVIRGRKNS
ncbi:MAG: VWA domain-containing protein [candidate division Zixibacteria bacterium]|nr:VWA domain-containing protein [candidate division Zixibacteria bacterium]MBU1469170.1 VWA domain-containing protein [candidate division Zixibacteria bacterium]MBU2625342.1 VWA domain-containing protein [candidate division Zixibacteria bacterium]